MPVPILVATPHSAFGELLRISLDDGGLYQVRLVHSAREARAAVQRASFPLAILDAILTDEPFVPLCYELIEQQPGIRLVIIPPDNNPNHPSLGGLIPHGYLNRPFYLPDLLDTVSRLMADRDRQLHAQAGASPAPAAAPSIIQPPWLQEPLTLRGYLEQELAGTQALAAMVGINDPRPGNGALRASAGAFSDETAQELAAVVFRYWNHAEKTDLMRFVRVSAGKNDHLVYATQIAGDMVLILVYDTSAPLSQIRPQTRAMAQALATHPPAGYLAGRKTTAPLTFTPAPDPLTAEKTPSAVLERQTQPLGDQPVTRKPEPGARQSQAVACNPQAGEAMYQPTADDNNLFDRRLHSISTAGQSAPPQVVQMPATGPSEGIPGVPENSPRRSESEPPAAGTSSPDDEDESQQVVGPVNLTALLGAVPPPDPGVDTRPGSDHPRPWPPASTASAPIPTLPGGWNSWEQENEDAGTQANQGNQRAGSDRPGRSTFEGAAAENNGRTRPKKKKLPVPSPLDFDALEMEPRSPSLPVDVLPAALPEYPMPGEPESQPDIARRLASMEGITEPPVKPPALPTAISMAAQGVEPEAQTDPLEDTRPRLLSTITNLNQLEASSPALSLLKYTCVLVPRLPQHYLTGEMADRLSLWVQQLCVAFGWRLEGIAIRPEYLQWTVQVAPAISPGNLVKVIRQRTSMHIFNNFAQLTEQNPSGDFWATGYLIVSGALPPSAQLLRDYITQTRKRQGIIK